MEIVKYEDSNKNEIKLLLPLEHLFFHEIGFVGEQFVLFSMFIDLIKKDPNKTRFVGANLDH